MKRNPGFKRAPMLLAAALALGATVLSGCTVTPASIPAGDRSTAQAADQRVVEDAHETLERLFRTAAGTREMVNNAAGTLVFPRVVGGAFVVGVQRGQGVMLIHNKPAGFYTTTGASVGFQVGAGSQAVVYVFNSRDALNRFHASNGWTVGVDATVAVGNIGANGSIDSRTAAQPVVSFVMNNTGVVGGVSLNGARISPVAH